MIVPMKKVTVLTQAKDASSVVDRLAALGVVHVEPTRVPQGTDLARLKEDLALIDSAIGILSETQFEAMSKTAPVAVEDWRAAAHRLADTRKRLDQLEEYGRVLEARIAFWKSWGDFSPETLNFLAGRGIHVRLYQVPAKEMIRMPAGVSVEILSVEAGLVRCAVVSRGLVDIPFPEVALPKAGLAAMETRLREDKATIASIREDIRSRSVQASAFRTVHRRVQKEIELQEAVEGMGAEAGVSYLVGYAPVDAERSLAEAAGREGWGLWMAEPSTEDNVPTLLKQPRWARLINPVFKLLEITPGYTELDVSPTFLIFFSLFFGMLIGDAGYGLVYLALTFWAHRKFGARVKDKALFKLFYLLSFCAVVWGLLTGTFFGQAWVLKTGLKPLMPALKDIKVIQAICFFIGAVHLTVGHVWRAAVLWPSRTAFAQVGWTSVVWASFFMARTLLLGDPFPVYGKFMIAGGVGLVVFFIDPKKNIFATVGAGLGAVALNLMNNFTDVVSYIRLFAVGLAGVAISDAFNGIAAGVHQGGIVSLVAAGLILIVGHALNLVLGPMSVLVHGVRLNVLEFSGHAGLTWSGVPYRPLKKDQGVVQ